MRVAIIGSGIAGLGAAWALRNHADVTLFEKQDRLGGHSNTVRVDWANADPINVDTGFIVYNIATYPNLIALFNALGVVTEASDMSFAVSLDKGRYEYAGDNLHTLIGTWQNLLSLKHWGMIADLIRFMRDGHRLCSADSTQSLGDFLRQNNYGRAFIERHLLPMASAIWSAPPQSIADFPAQSFGQFFRNHGLLESDIAKRPPWRTVTGGSKQYVEKLINTAKPTTILNTSIAHIDGQDNQAIITFQDGQRAEFDHVIIATHADEAKTLLHDNSVTEGLLESFQYSANAAYLHSDPNLMPKRQNLWSSWNYLRKASDTNSAVFVSYWMNRLQNIDQKYPLFVSLNPTTQPDTNKIWKKIVYHHPQFDRQAKAAQGQLSDIQGLNNLWFCGSYFGYGFHEDALASGLSVAEALGAKREWNVTDISPAFANATPKSRAKI
jgi:hypothetical protein